MKEKVMVTGASRGIGAAAAERFAKEGHPLVLLCRTGTTRLEKKAETLRRYGVPVFVYQGDVGDPAFAERLFQQEKDVQILVNNAGVAHFGVVQDITDEIWDRVLSTNLSGAFYLTRAALPSMLKAGRGRILNVSSVFGTTGASCESAYAASKGGLNALTRSLAKELALSHISVNAVAFGCIDTEMNGRLTPEERAALEEEIPAGRFATAEEAADFLYLLSQAPAYLTGQVIAFDGGWG